MKYTICFYSDRLRRMIRYAIGFATAGVGIAYMLSVIAPRLRWDSMLGVWPIDLRFIHLIGMHRLTVIVGFFLVMLSYGLMRGKHQAWRIALSLLLLSALLHIVHRGAISTTLVVLGLSLLLTILYRFFRARSDPPSVRRGYILLLLGLGVVLFYTIGGFFALYDQFEVLVDRVGTVEAILRLVSHSHIHLPPASQALFYTRALPLLCMSAVLYGMVQILRPVAAALNPNEKERQRVWALARTYGKNSTSYFALSEDKSYYFSTSGKAVISYVLKGNVAVIAGDPIGPEAEISIVIKQFMEYCREQDWTLAFWQVRNDLAELYRSLGLHLLKIGEDAVVNAHTFTLKGGAMANVRSSAKRAEKDGVAIVFYRGQVQNAEQLTQMGQISAHWLARKGGAEWAFSMGHFDPSGDDEQLSVVAIDGTNRVHAFATFVPIYGRNGWGLDLMRRAEDCAPGTMELLLARSIEYLGQRGADMVSLGLAPLSNANAEDETLLDTSVDLVIHHFGSLSKSASLSNFKKKFQPTWENRYLVFSSTLTLPKLGWALYQAHQQQETSLARTLRRSLLGRRRGYHPKRDTVQGIA